MTLKGWVSQGEIDEMLATIDGKSSGGFKEFMQAKKAGHKTTTRKSLKIKENGRSADFIIPGFATGCQLACAYCYVARHRPYGNSMHSYTNIESICKAVSEHSLKLGIKKTPNQCDHHYWTYDIGENTDCALPANYQNLKTLIQYMYPIQFAKPTFATKIGFRQEVAVLGRYAYYGDDDPPKLRIRMSLMPDHISKILEPGTSSVLDRIKAIDKYLSYGWEVHVNFSPVVIYEGWTQDYLGLMDLINIHTNLKSKEQLKAEVIFLTHHPKLHESNMNWNPEAEKLMWTPENQERKTTLRGDNAVVRYKAKTVKKQAIDRFKHIMAERMPYCPIRYIF